jgi:hypothetical protein
MPNPTELELSQPRLLSQPVSFLTAAVFAATLSFRAQSGETKNFGAQWAFNNNWGDGGNSAINATFGSGSTPSMTVSFNFSTDTIHGYPACIRGWHYGANPLGNTQFPMQVSAVASIPCAFSYSSGGSNTKGDFAYDMFLRKDNAKSTPQLEVMVWGGNNSWPIGSRTGTNVLSVGGYTFDLWEGMNTEAGYYVYTFIPSGPVGDSHPLPTSGSLNVDIKLFFNWLQANRSGSGRYNDSMYLDVVEAGFEVCRGNGWALITADLNANLKSTVGDKIEGNAESKIH